MTQESRRSAFYASRPRIRIDGNLIQSLGDAVLQTVLVEETTQGLFRCEASFINFGPRSKQVDFFFFDRQTIDFGKTISIEFGPPGEAGPTFAGRISGLEGNYPQERDPELLVLAEDRFQDLRMERRTRTFENMTDADVMRQVVSQHGLTARIDLEGPTHRILAQVNQSDLAFLRERAAALDAEIWMDDRTFYAQARSRRSSGSITFTYGKDLLEFSVLADLAHQRTAVRVSGWDVGSKSAIDEEAGVIAIQAELNGRRAGSTVLEALAPRTERMALSTPISRDEAKKLAEARYRSRARAFVRGQGVVDGSVRLRVGSTIELAKLGPFFNGPYYVTLARHSFDMLHGYRTMFLAERPGIGG